MIGHFLKDWQHSDRRKGTLMLAQEQEFCNFIADCIEEMKLARNMPGVNGGDYDTGLSDVQAYLRERK